jgi:adenylate cyclase
MSDTNSVSLITTILNEIHYLRELAHQTITLLKNQPNIPNTASQALEQFTTSMGRLEHTLTQDHTETEQLRFLVKTGAMINAAFNVEDVLSTALDAIIQLVQAERGYIIFWNAQTGEYEFPAMRDHTNLSNHASAPKISQTILSQVIQTGEALLTDNAYKDQRWQEGASIAQMGLRSVLCVPLHDKEAVIGAIYVDNRIRAGVFTEREKRLLTALANQIAVALNNTQLYLHIRQSLEEIRQLKQLMDDVFASIGSGVITTTAENEIVMLNRAAEAILKQTSSQLIGATLQEVLPNTEHYLNKQPDGVNDLIEAEMQIARQRVILQMRLSRLKRGLGMAIVMDDMTEKKTNEETLALMRRYLPPEMVDNIHTISRLALGGERRLVTCMFVDVRPVDTFPHYYSPRAVMEHLNLYLTRATDCIHAKKGIIDKYMGNVIMALFNTQLNPMDDHAKVAVEVALNIRDSFIQFYNQQGINPEPHYYRVGIHTGIATLGNVGSLTRREFSAIGDTINLAKRLEENARYGQIIVSDQTLQAGGLMSHSADLNIVEQTPLQVKGRQQNTHVYEIIR